MNTYVIEKSCNFVNGVRIFPDGVAKSASDLLMSREDPKSACFFHASLSTSGISSSPSELDISITSLICILGVCSIGSERIASVSALVGTVVSIEMLQIMLVSLDGSVRKQQTGLSSCELIDVVPFYAVLSG